MFSEVVNNEQYRDNSIQVNWLYNFPNSEAFLLFFCLTYIYISISGYGLVFTIDMKIHFTRVFT